MAGLDFRQTGQESGPRSEVGRIDNVQFNREIAAAMGSAIEYEGNF